MKHKLLCGALAISGCMSLIAVAQNGNPPPPPAADYSFDFSPFIAEVDTNKDGQFSKEEWANAGQHGPILDMLDSDKNGTLSVAELTARMPQKEADKNGDGKISAAELADLPNMGPKGDGPPPPQ